MEEGSTNYEEAKTAQQQESSRKKGEWLAPWQFKPGQSGNPSGRKPGKSLKEYAKEMLATMTEEERNEFMKGLSKDIIWKMAEGNPKNDFDLKGTLTIANVLDELEYDRPETTQQGVEDQPPLQD